MTSHKLADGIKKEKNNWAYWKSPSARMCSMPYLTSANSDTDQSVTSAAMIWLSEFKN